MTTIQLQQPSHLTVVESRKNYLDRIVAGDREAFWPLWQQHQSYLYQRCLHWMNYHRSNADEAYSQAMLKAWEKLPQYAAKIYNVRSWLARLTYRVCVDFYRAQAKVSLSLDAECDAHLSWHETLAADTENPDQQLQRSELGDTLHQLIECLPERLRQPFVMRFCEAQSYAAIATQLQLTQPTVRKRIQEARQILRRKVQRYESGLELREFALSAA